MRYDPAEPAVNEIALVRGPVTVLIPAGAFDMGDASGRPDEQPVHRVHVSAFGMALLPVTNADYAIFVAAAKHEEPRFWHDPKFYAPDQPVVGVSWFDAGAYCEWLSAAIGGTYRLPTEAEREKAARGGVTSLYPWGDDPGADGGRLEQDAPCPVGQREPNGYGLFDMGWNVHEWCSDWYDAEYYAHSPSADPEGPPSGKRRASRGGAWRHQIKVSRCAARSSIPPELRYNDYGFRVVMSVPSA